MNQLRFSLSEDLPTWGIPIVVGIGLLYLMRVLSDARSSSRRRAWLMVADMASALSLAGCLLRPQWVEGVATPVGARIAVLVDGSRRLDIKAGDRTRAQAAADALRALKHHFSSTRLAVFEFGYGPLRPRLDVARQGAAPAPKDAGSGQSDLTGALEQLEDLLGERPNSVVVVSDGRFSRPVANGARESFLVPGALRGTVVHAVDVGGVAPKDASILSVQTSGNAVAHQPLSIDIVVGCFGGLACKRVPVTVREYKKGVEPSTLANGEASFTGEDTARLSLELTIERAGPRVIEVAIDAPKGDAVPENDVRFITLQVLRDRLRLLHVAGRPTYDVRARRQWLKSDTSVDLVSYFILRTDADDTNTDFDSELALIPFPVDELFDEHLASFDAVLLADIDAERYRLSRYLDNLARYVEQGGGLILIGGPSAFSGGAYASSPLDRVLPVTLVQSERPFDTVDFVPRVTSAGRDAALLQPLRSIAGDELPRMPGANSLGIARPRAVVLWEHPNRTVLPVKTGGAPGAMPVLAVSEVRDGRVVALAVDGTHRLAFGSEAAKTGGRAYGALWDGLLGWVIRDPRFESSHGELIGECIAKKPARAEVVLSKAATGELNIEIERLGTRTGASVLKRVPVREQRRIEIELGVLDAGAYSAMVRVGDEPPTRFDFACESGGAAWADTRPDNDRLEHLSAANGGIHVDVANVSRLPQPATALVHGTRRTRPLLAPWIWALACAVSLALNWLLRRTEGLS